jgi:microcystin-dependent protein
MARNYSSVVEPKALTANITSSTATQITLNNVTGLPSPPYVLVINPDTAKEEVVLVTVDQTGVTSPTLKVERAIEASGGVGVARSDHTIGDVVKHMIVGSDLQIPHDHIDNTSAHDATGGVVGATKTQTLTNKTINLNNNTLTGTTAQFNAALSDADFATTALLEARVPVGVLAPYAGSTAPTGWLLCAGQSISKTTYSALHGVIGVNTYGTDTGSDFFLPDLRGRVIAGKDNMNGTTASRLTSLSGMSGTTLGAVGGNQLLQGHSHNILSRPIDNVGTGANYTAAGTTTQNVTATATDPTGDGNSQNVQPTIILNYIIKF